MALSCARFSCGLGVHDTPCHVTRLLRAASCKAQFTASSSTRDYAASVKYCASIGMTIASIHSQAENNAIKSMLRTTSYVGATEIGNGGTSAKHWKWDDGTPWDYINPSNDGLRTSENRIAFSTGNPQWHDWCAHRAFVTKSSPCPAGLPSARPRGRCDAVSALALVGSLHCLRLARAKLARGMP